MPKGFFAKSTLLQSREPPSRHARCGACGLYKGCKSPKMPVTGKGERGILVVAEAPGAEEDARGEQLIGKAGRRLRRTMTKHGIDLDNDCWKTNTLICRPPNNRTPSDNEIEYCRPNLLRTVEDLNPRVLVLLGGVAIKSYIGHTWKEDPGGVGKWAGWQIPLREPNMWIVPTFHPSYLERESSSVLDAWFDEHICGVSSLLGRPWHQTPPHPKRAVRVEYDDETTARLLRRMIDAGGRISFDYETNMLKPDAGNSRILCCSVCHEGKRTIAFPWRGNARVAMGEVLRADSLTKMGWNIKFEERWTLKDFGHGVSGWIWDGMVNSHLLDNQPGVTSIKFQSFVKLGLPLWNQHIDPFFESGGSYEDNKVLDSVDYNDLLIYCGIDSWAEYKVCEQQMEAMK